MSASILRTASASKATPRKIDASRLVGRILTGIVMAFMIFDTGFKFTGAKEAIDSTVQLGFQSHHLTTIALVEVVCVLLYLVPRTAPIGAVLLTGYFGGAILTHIRVDNPLFSHILFPTYLGAMMWLGLYLRDARVRALLGARS